MSRHVHALRLFVLVVVAGLAFSVPAVAADKYLALPIGKDLYDEVLHHDFVTKTMLGNAMEATTSAHINGARLVDTEFYMDGSIKFYVRRGFSNGDDLLTGGKYVGWPDITSVFQAGTTVSVQLVEFFPDRIELHLLKQGFNASQPGGYAKIKLMLGKGYDSWPADKILQFLDTIIPIRSIENKQRAEDNYKSLLSSINTTKALPNSNPLQTYQNMAALARDYNAIVDPIAALQQINDPLVATDKIDYTDLERKAEAQLPSLKTAADSYEKQQAEIQRQQHNADLQKQVQTLKADVTKQLAVLAKTHPASEADFAKRTGDLDAMQQKLQSWTSAENELAGQNLGSATATKQITSAQASLARLRADLDASRVKLKTGAIDAKYRALESKRAQLSNAFAASFGTPQAGAAKAALRDCLQQIYANRIEALNAGNHAAQQQADEAQESLRKLQ